MWTELRNRWEKAQPVLSREEKERLETAWRPLESEQRRLLETARTLDGDWEALAIESRAAAYSARYQDFKAADDALTRDAARYRRECVGSLPEAEYRRCVRRAAEINRRWRLLNERAERLNAELDVIVSQRTAHFERAIAYEERGRAWEKKLIRFNAQVRAEMRSMRESNHVSIHVQVNTPGADQPRLVEASGNNLTRAEALALADTIVVSARARLSDTARLDALIPKVKHYLSTVTTPPPMFWPSMGNFGSRHPYRLDLEVTGDYPAKP